MSPWMSSFVLHPRAQQGRPSNKKLSGKDLVGTVAVRSPDKGIDDAMAKPPDAKLPGSTSSHSPGVRGAGAEDRSVHSFTPCSIMEPGRVNPDRKVRKQVVERYGSAKNKTIDIDAFDTFPYSGSNTATLPSNESSVSRDNVDDNSAAAVTVDGDVESQQQQEPGQPRHKTNASPRQPQTQVQPGAFHAGLDYGLHGPNARDVSVVEDDGLTVHSSLQQPASMSIARVEEVSAVLVDEDEEERKKQERLDKELQKALKQKEMDVPVADVGRGLWCSRRVKIASSVGCFVALVAAVLGVLFGVVFKPKPPPPSEGLIELFSSMSFDGGEALRSTSTPQNKAYNWLANNNTNLGSYSDERKIQRYVLATLC